MSDSVKVNIDVDFKFNLEEDEYLSERNTIYNLLNNFSDVGGMTISRKTLKLIYRLRHMNPLPKFRDLTRLRITMSLNSSLELLPIVLERCPNLKRLILKLDYNDYREAVAEATEINLSNVLSNSLVSSLEYVEIKSPTKEKPITTWRLVRYFLGNATLLKKLVLRLNVSDTREKHDPAYLKEFFDSERRSHLCQF
ncbi:unnamed protein product, partial [Thlaspi arvense]